MALEITVGTHEDFMDMIDQKDFRIAKAVVNTIFGNIKSKKKDIHVLTVNCEEENESFDITIDSKNFADSLEEMLPFYIKEELYEECQKIADTITLLKSNSNNGNES